MSAFAIDLDQLADTISTLADTGRHCDEALDVVATRVARLHDTWSGHAAAAQADAQARWEDGLRAMTEALADMRTAAETAERNYRSAVDVNVGLWTL